LGGELWNERINTTSGNLGTAALNILPHPSTCDRGQRQLLPLQTKRKADGRGCNVLTRYVRLSCDPLKPSTIPYILEYLPPPFYRPPPLTFSFLLYLRTQTFSPHILQDITIFFSRFCCHCRFLCILSLRSHLSLGG
jgi:hypothetical protein